MTNRIIKSRGSLIRGRIISRFLRRVPDSLIIRKGRGGEERKKIPRWIYFYFFVSSSSPQPSPSSKTKVPSPFGRQRREETKGRARNFTNNFSPNKGFILKAIDSRKISALTFASLISYSSPKFDSFGR